MKKVEVLSSAGDNTPNIVSSDDYLFLPCARELGFFTAEVPYINEVDPDAINKKFPIFVDSNSRYKRLYNNTGTSVSYWLRSPYSQSSSYWVYCYGSSYSYTYGSYYIAPCFCI